MNWITNYVRPKIRALVAPRDVPENLWQKCPKCGAMLFQKDLEANLHVCPQCGFHMRIGPKLRLGILFDDGHFQTIELPKVPADPLKFRDQKRYSDRAARGAGENRRAGCHRGGARHDRPLPPR